MKFVKVIASLVLLFCSDISARKMHRRVKGFTPCTYSLIGDECTKISKKAACDQKYRVCKRANGQECTTNNNDDDERKDCLTGSTCDQTKSTSMGWGICVDKETLGTKFIKGLYHLGIKLDKK